MIDSFAGIGELLSSQGVIMVMIDPIQGGKWMRADARRTDDRFLSQTEWKSELGTKVFTGGGTEIKAEYLGWRSCDRFAS